MDDLVDLLDGLPQHKNKTPSKSKSPTKPEKSVPSHLTSLGQKKETSKPESL